MFRVNLLTFVVCLLGIQAFAAKREVAAGGWLVAAAATKLTPVFFLPWLVIRGSRRSLLAVLAFGALCLMVPVIQRGVAQGSADLRDYYWSFLHQFAAVPWLRIMLALVVLAACLVHIIRLRTANQPVGALEISSVFLTGHLLSGITFKAHLVTLLFVFYAFFTLDPRRVGRAGRWASVWPG